jgi:hypothetical protein
MLGVPLLRDGTSVGVVILVRKVARPFDAARLLLEASWSGVGHAAVLGPEDLSFNDMAAIIADVLGKKYPPAKPGALVLKPLKAAYPYRTSQASLPLCGMLHAS